MTSSLIDALLYPPNALIKDGDERSRRTHAVSLLIENRIQEYDQECEAATLPLSTEGEQANIDDPERGLASGLVMLRRGMIEGLEVIQAVAKAPSAQPDVRLTAAVIASVALADVGRPDWGLRALHENKVDARTVQERALWNIQVSVRHAEQGDFEDALAYCKAALRLSAKRRDPSSVTLLVVASRNEAELAFAAEGRFVPRVPPTSKSPTLASIAIDAGEGTTQYLDDHFQAFFDDPYTRSWRFVQQDLLDESLLQALLRCEVVGYRAGARRLRKSLGEYRLLSQAGASGSGAASGFALLRRAGDAAGLKRAVRVFRASGPIEVLREVGEAMVQGSWLTPDMNANLELLAGSAFAFRAKTSALAFDRLASAMPDLIEHRVGGAWLASPAFSGMAALLGVVDVGRANAGSAMLREIAERPPDALIHQSMEGAINQLPWPILSREERERWSRYVQANLSATDDHIFPARIAAQALIALGDRRASKFAADAFRQTHSLWLAPFLISNPSMKTADKTVLVDEIVRVAADVRARAMTGQYSMGGISIGALLGHAASRFRDQRAKKELALFVLEPRVPADERVECVQPLLESPKTIPRWLSEKLANGLPPPAEPFPILGAAENLDATNLRLRGRFGTIAVTELISGAIALANSPSVETRANAGQTIVELSRRLPPAVTATLFLSLSHDPVPLVRGWAGRSLAQFGFEDEAFERARIGRLIELVAEPGEVVPALVYQGLAEGSQSSQVALRLMTTARLAAQQHIAVTVRKAAQRAVAKIGG